MFQFELYIYRKKFELVFYYKVCKLDLSIDKN